ncbi:MAG: hypothetical protein ACLP19_19525 [Xanthobacteraceae bacterium]
MSRNKFDVSGVLQKLVVATKASLIEHGGKNTVVLYFRVCANSHGHCMSHMA